MRRLLLSLPRLWLLQHLRFRLTLFMIRFPHTEVGWIPNMVVAGGRLWW